MFPNEHGGNYFRCYKSTSAWRRRNPTGNLNPINTNLFRRSYYRNALQILQNYFLLLAIARRIYSFLLFSRGISVITTSNIDFNSFVRLIDWRRGLGGGGWEGSLFVVIEFSTFQFKIRVFVCRIEKSIDGIRELSIGSIRKVCDNANLKRFNEFVYVFSKNLYQTMEKT